MNPALTNALERVKSVLATISLGQKVVIGLLVAGLLLGGIFFTKWITAPTYAPLFSNLSSTDASAIVAQLDTAGVPYELADGNATIMVPKDQVNAQRLAAAAAGLPSSDATGYALLDQQGITTSEFQQHVDYQRAMAGELENTLESMKGVQTAVVNLTIPGDTVFTDDQKKPTASVLLSLSPGTTLTSEQITAVTNLVSFSIEGMDPKDVSVTDSEGHVLAVPGTGVTAGSSDAQTQAEAAAGASLAATAQALLDQVAGPGNAVVTVHADVDFSDTNSTTEGYSYNDGTPALSETQGNETYTGAAANTAGGVLGPENQTTTGSTGGDSSYNQTSSTTNNAVDKTTTTVDGVPGTISRITVSVVLNSATTGTPLNQADVQSVISNSVGYDPARGDAITVASMAFDTSSNEQAAAALAAAQAADEKAQLYSYIKTGAIGLGIALLVLIAWLRSRRRRPEVEEEEYEDLEMSDEHMRELERLRVESSRDAALEARKYELEGAQRERVRNEIAEMISDRPDEVATMLRSWFAESQ